MDVLDKHPAAVDAAAAQADARCDDALAQFALENYGLAAGRARAALELVPDHSESRFVLGVSLARLGDSPVARDVLREVCQGRQAARLARTPGLLEAAQAVLRQLEAELPEPGPRPDAVPCSTFDPTHPRWTGVGAAKYDLGHLNQKGHQRVAGPVQDDEALLLYALMRVVRARRVLEVGGLGGYSARNFLAAMAGDGDVALYTVDLRPVPARAPWHHIITKDCGELTPQDVDGQPLDVVFFDAHVVEPQLRLLDRLERHGLLRPHTLLALHDTGLHRVREGHDNARDRGTALVDTDGTAGLVHQPAEREMVNRLRAQGWDAVPLHMPPDRGDDALRFRHGLTLLRRVQHLAT